ncbi:MAG TPA: NAD-binding protein [Gaiellaceae bacterium]|nr:NAD-binding protein [Gaiellaceae bacterium]
MESPITLRHFRYALLGFIAAWVGGALAFWWTVDGTALDSVYRSTATISLTGIDTRPETVGGEVITIGLIFAGMAIYAYIAGALVEVVARGVLTGAWSERRRLNVIDKLSDHYIICGYGRVGQAVADEFRTAGVPYVVLDFDPDALAAASERHELWIDGSGTNDHDLEAAGIERARGLVASGDSDADNLFITISARTMRPNLLVVARASDAETHRKLLRAGADRVTQPFATAGSTMAKLVLRPQVAAFLDIVTTEAGPDTRLEEFEVTPASGSAGRTIRELRLRKETGALVIAVRRRDGSFDTTPSPDTALSPGDVIIAVGTDEELTALGVLFAPREAVAG